GLLAAVLPYPKRFAAAMRLGMLARPVIARMPAGVARLRGLLQERFDPRVHARRLASPSSSDRPSAGFAGAAARPTRRVALLEGCVESVLTPEIHAAAKRVLAAAGVDVVSVPGCCGSIVHHLGRERDNRRLAGALIDSLQREIDGEGLDAILSTASGCGTHAKDYGFLFRNDASIAARAASVAERVQIGRA